MLETNLTYAALQTLVDTLDLTFSDCVSFFCRKQTPEQNALAAKAAEEYEEEGTLEIDDNAIVSDSTESNEDGAYVMAWVWVSK